MTNVAAVGLLAETPLHPRQEPAAEGPGVRTPVAREPETGWPYLPEACVQEAVAAHGIALSDGVTGQLLLLPVRSLEHPCKWVCTPALLERFARTFEHRALARELEALELARGRALSAGEYGRTLYLEELQVEVRGSLPDGLVEAIAPLIANASVAGRLAERLVLVDDADFAYLARFGLMVAGRSRLSCVGAMERSWLEEALPPDTLLYLAVSADEGGALEGALGREFYLQVGGHETTGRGWCQGVITRFAPRKARKQQ